MTNFQNPIPLNGSTLVVAEIGFNHGGDLTLAQRMIEQAAQCGVQAVKLQTFHTAELHLPQTQFFQELKKSELDLAAHKTLCNNAKKLGLTLFSTPFSPQDVDLLEQLPVSLYKVASMDLNNVPLLRTIAQTQRPILLSTGMSTLAEIDQALTTLVQAGHKQKVVLMHCISLYPTAPSQAHLEFIPLLQDTFGLPVGYSDHTLGMEIAWAAVALGACVLEKHFTTDKGLPGPDHQLALDPGEMTRLVQGIKRIDQAQKNKRSIFSRPDRDQAPLFRRGIYARQAIPAGTTLTPDLLKAVRPEEGISVAQWDEVLGRKNKSNLEKDQCLTWNELE